MGLTVGVSGSGGNTQQEWANIINTNTRAIDEHNHASGSGVRIPSAGLNIDADLSFNSYSASGLLTSGFTSQGSSLASSYKSCVYVVNGNLYFNNGSGTAVQVTTGSSVNVGGTGTISGMGGTASVAFDGTSIYAFSRSSGIYADLAVSGLKMYHATSGAANALSMGVAANLTTAYSILWPNQTPNAAGGNIFPELDTSGNVTWKKSVVNDGSNAVGRVAYFSDTKTLASLALGAGQLLIGTSTSTAPSVATLTGTSNQVTVTTGSGSITLSLPQNIHTAATPTFAGLTLSGALSGTSVTLSGTLSVASTVSFSSTANFSGNVNVAVLSANAIVATNGSKNLSSVTYSSSSAANSLVYRDSSGNFEAAHVTLSGDISVEDSTVRGFLYHTDFSSGVRMKKLSTTATGSGSLTLAHGLSGRSKVLSIIGQWDTGSQLSLMDYSTNTSTNRMNISYVDDTNVFIVNNIPGSYSYTVNIYIVYSN